jgi:hypothetical protein
MAAVVFLGLLPSLASATSLTRAKTPTPPLGGAQSGDDVTTLRALDLPLSAPTPVPTRITVPKPITFSGAVCLGYAGPRLTFPLCGATANAIRLIASGKVSHGYNRCAQTVHEALGFSLGDAHSWLQLPSVGFVERTGEPAQPGDIIVYPFTYGARRSQHIGFAVGTQAGVRLLSNLCGRIRVSDLVGGYAAFYKPAAPAAFEPQPATMLTSATLESIGPRPGPG